MLETYCFVSYTYLLFSLQSSKSSIRLDLSAAETSGFHYGVKLVRGAYMEQERELAKNKGIVPCSYSTRSFSLAAVSGYDDPIWDTKAQTDDNYHQILDILMHRITGNERVNLMVASHNEDTIKDTLNK